MTVGVYARNATLKQVILLGTGTQSIAESTRLQLCSVFVKPEYDQLHT